MATPTPTRMIVDIYRDINAAKSTLAVEMNDEVADDIAQQIGLLERELDRAYEELELN